MVSPLYFAPVISITVGWVEVVVEEGLARQRVAQCVFGRLLGGLIACCYLGLVLINHFLELVFLLLQFGRWHFWILNRGSDGGSWFLLSVFFNDRLHSYDSFVRFTGGQGSWPAKEVHVRCRLVRSHDTGRVGRGNHKRHQTIPSLYLLRNQRILLHHNFRLYWFTTKKLFLLFHFIDLYKWLS